MIRQRALAWAAVLALVVALQMASLPIRPLPVIAASVAQDSPDADAGQPVELAVVALHCAAAPAAEALTSFFATGAAPAGCAPAVGVSIAVVENGTPLSGSPFTTDTSGTLGVRIGLGSVVTLREDPRSLPAGYEPLTREANGVPYANPVQLGSAEAGTAALFVNVPATLAATLNQGTPAEKAGEPVDLAVAVTPNRTGCDPAYPDERTCIPPGSPLDAPCSITAERNFTVLSPDPRGLDADGDGIGCEPISSGGGAAVTLYAGNDSRPVPLVSNGNLSAPISNGDLAVAANPDRIDDGVWVLPPDRNRTDNWLVHRDRNRADDWLVQSDRSNNNSVAIVSNFVIIGNGLWRWDDHHQRDNRFWLKHITIGNFTIARSSNGSLAIVSNSVFISNGFRTWFGRQEDNRLGLNRIVIGNLTIARSGNGSLAIVSNPVLVGNGLWTWGGHQEDNWLAPGRTPRADAPDAELIAINGGESAIESPPNTLEQADNSEQPTLALNNALSVALPDDSVAQPSDASVEPSPDTAISAPPSDDAVTAPPSDPAIESPPSDTAVQPAPDTDVAPAPSDNTVAPPPDDGYVAPAPSDSYVAPSSDNSVQPPPPDDAMAPPADFVQPPDTAVAPPPDAAIAPPSDGYVEPPPSDIGAPEPVNIAPEPVNVVPGVDPDNVMPDPIIVGPSAGDSGTGDFVTIAPDPVDVAPSNGVPDLGIVPGGGDFGSGAPDPVSVAPGNSDFGVDPGSGDPGNVVPNPGNVAPDPIGVSPDNGDSGTELEGENG